MSTEDSTRTGPVATVTPERTATAPGAAHNGAAPRKPDSPASKTAAKRPAPRPQRPAPRPAPGAPRRVRLLVSRVDPWSVMKLSFLLSVAIGIAMVVAAGVLWTVLDGMGVFTDVNDLVAKIMGSSGAFDINDYVGFGKVLSIGTVLAVVNVVLLTALSTLGAFLYNIAASLVGGLHLTLSDD